MTEGGHAYHVNPDCPALHERRKHPVSLKTHAVVRGDYYGCEVCVNGVCSACAAGRHMHCSPGRSQLAACECERRGHR